MPTPSEPARPRPRGSGRDAPAIPWYLVRPGAAIGRFAETGLGHVYVHQVGPDQEGFFRYYEREVLPTFR